MIISVKCTLIEEALGMTPCTEEAFNAFIEYKKSKSKKMQLALDDAKYQRELQGVRAAMTAQEVENSEKNISVFPRSPEDPTVPVFYKHQIRGFFKDNLKALRSTGAIAMKKNPGPFVDRALFVGPDEIKIRLPEGTEIGILNRIVRMEDKRCPGVYNTAFKKSEVIPAGSVIKFNVELVDESEKTSVLEALKYGTVRGFGEWRNSGKGRFSTEIYNVQKKVWEPLVSTYGNEINTVPEG